MNLSPASVTCLLSILFFDQRQSPNNNVGTVWITSTIHLYVSLGLLLLHPSIHFFNPPFKKFTWYFKIDSGICWQIFIQQFFWKEKLFSFVSLLTISHSIPFKSISLVCRNAIKYTNVDNKISIELDFQHNNLLNWKVTF